MSTPTFIPTRAIIILVLKKSVTCTNGIFSHFVCLFWKWLIDTSQPYTEFWFCSLKFYNLCCNSTLFSCSHSAENSLLNWVWGCRDNLVMNMVQQLWVLYFNPFPKLRAIKHFWLWSRKKKSCHRMTWLTKWPYSNIKNGIGKILLLFLFKKIIWKEELILGPMSTSQWPDYQWPDCHVCSFDPSYRDKKGSSSLGGCQAHRNISFFTLGYVPRLQHHCYKLTINRIFFCWSSVFGWRLQERLAFSFLVALNFK